MGVLGLHDALDDDLAAPLVLDPGHVVPRQGRVELLAGPGRQRAGVAHTAGVADDVAEGAPLRVQHVPAPVGLGGQVDEVGQRGLGGRGQAVLDVLVPLAEDLQVKRDDQRRALGGLGAVDEPLDEALVLHDVELEPERAAGVLGHVLDRADAHGGERERHPELLGGAGCEDLAVGVLHAGEPCGGQCHRHRHVLADHRVFQRAVFHVDRHALAELDLLESGFVGAVGGFRPGAGVRVVVEHARHATLGNDSEIFDAGNDRGHGGVPSVQIFPRYYNPLRTPRALYGHVVG